MSPLAQQVSDIMNRILGTFIVLVVAFFSLMAWLAYLRVATWTWIEAATANVMGTLVGGGIAIVLYYHQQRAEAAGVRKASDAEAHRKSMSLKHALAEELRHHEYEVKAFISDETQGFRAQPPLDGTVLTASALSTSEWLDDSHLQFALAKYRSSVRFFNAFLMLNNQLPPQQGEKSEQTIAMRKTMADHLLERCAIILRQLDVPDRRLTTAAASGEVPAASPASSD